MATRRPALRIGELYVAGDHACAQGDLDAIARLSARVAAAVPPPLAREARRLAAVCASDRARATDAWTGLKELAQRPRRR